MVLHHNREMLDPLEVPTSVEGISNSRRAQAPENCLRQCLKFMCHVGIKDRFDMWLSGKVGGNLL